MCGGWREPMSLTATQLHVIAPSVAPGNRRLGVMLPYTGLHHLLAAEIGEPFVLTSGNLSDEPIAHDDDDARRRLADIADVFLVHDRPIHSRVDDSVTRVFRGREIVLRRSRGYAPRPVALPWDFARPVLACGAELKHTFCLGKGHHAFVSHHIGDLENYETWQSFTSGVEHFGRLFDIRPEVVAHDLHPEYLSTKYALELEEAAGHLALTGVQHHHAHVAACLADNGEAGPVIGVAFDGLGLGHRRHRLGRRDPGGRPGRLRAGRPPRNRSHARRSGRDPGAVADGRRLARRHLRDGRAGAPRAASPPRGPLARRVPAGPGRAVVAGDVVGRAAVRRRVGPLRDPGRDPLRGSGRRRAGAAGRTRRDGQLPAAVRGRDRCCGSRAGELIRAVVDDLGRGAPAGVVAARFHRGLAAGVVSACRAVRAERGLTTVACSGGVFQNALLLGLVADGLEAEGFRVLLHSRVPPNDGGISLGQAACAGARDRQGEI